MKKYILILLTSVVTLSSCSDWFDVTSGSEIREKDHYSTLAGFQQSLIGCYISMTDNALYGKELSWYAIEILGHQFNPVTSNSSNSREMQEYEIWEAMMSAAHHHLNNLVYGSPWAGRWQIQTARCRPD